MKWRTLLRQGQLGNGLALFGGQLREVLQAAHVADAVDPVPHRVVSVRSQIVRASGGLNVEDVLKLALHEEPRVYLLALVQVDDALQLAARLVGVVLEQILARQLSLLQGKPPSSPSLERNYILVELRLEQVLHKGLQKSPSSGQAG